MNLIINNSVIFGATKLGRMAPCYFQHVRQYIIVKSFLEERVVFIVDFLKSFVIFFSNKLLQWRSSNLSRNVI